MKVMKLYLLFLVAFVQDLSVTSAVKSLSFTNLSKGDIIEIRLRVPRKAHTIIAFRPKPKGRAPLYFRVQQSRISIVNGRDRSQNTIINSGNIRNTVYFRVWYTQRGLELSVNGRKVLITKPLDVVKEVALVRSISSSDAMKLMDESKYYCTDRSRYQCGMPTKRNIPIPRNLCRSEHRIVGGRAAKPGQHPWQVALRKWMYNHEYEQHFCGGTLIDKCWVVTAAHCFAFVGSSVSSLYYVRVGDYSNTDDGDFEALQDLPIDKIYKHEGFRRAREPKISNDITLIKLKVCATISEFVRPICLPTLTAVADNPIGTQECTITGWGASEFRQAQKEYFPCLQQAKIPIASSQNCSRQYGAKVNTTVAFCAGKPGVDSCQGDSGGPLICDGSNHEKTLWGVISWGENCAIKYGVYTNVTVYSDWINNKMWEDCGQMTSRKAFST